MAMPDSSKVAIAIRITPQGADPIWLTSVEDNSVQASSTVTEYPIVNGSLVADHMFKEAVTYSISGTWGYNNLDTYKVPKTNALLSNFQKTFEDIKNNGTICDIVKITTRENGPQFLKRTNMILQSLTWTEGTNSLSYAFTFRQILSAEVGIQEVDTKDIYLPKYDEMQMLNFTDTLIDWTMVTALILDECVQEEIIDKKFIEYMQEGGNVAIAMALGVGVAATIKTIAAVAAWKALATGTGALAAALGASASAAGWVGLAIALIIAAGAAIVGAIKRKKKAKELFEWVEGDDEANKETSVKIANFLNEVHKSMTLLNSAISIYQISSNDEHEAILGIEDMYYIFSFSKNTASNKFEVSVRDINDKPIKTKYQFGALEA